MSDPETLSWPTKHQLFGVEVSAARYDDLVERLLQAAEERNGAAATFLAVHGLVTAALDPEFRARVNMLEVVAPDGQPVRWALNLFFKAGLSDRVYGPELMHRLCRAAASTGVGIYLYGSTPEVVQALKRSLISQFPRLQIMGAEPSLFRPLSPEEDEALVQRINSSGAGLLFIGLGCPRQEVFAFQHRLLIEPAQLCVGAAFDFHAGNKAMAPRWMQNHGMEWLFRLTQEPARLWRRYLVTNTTFCLLVMRRVLTGY